MKQIVICCCVVISLISCHAQEKGIPDKILNQKTNEHILVPGTKLYIIPPKGFKLSTDFIGFKKDDNTIIYIFDFAGENIQKHIADFERATSTKEGQEQLTDKKIQFNNCVAKFRSVGGADNKEYAIYFGDSTFADLIFTVFPKGDDSLDRSLKRSLLTCYYDKNASITIPDLKGFKLNDSTTKLKFSNYVGSIYYYSPNERQNDSSSLSLILVPFPYDSSKTIEDYSETYFNSLKRKGIVNIVIKSASKELINGIEAYEVEAYAENSGIKALIYELIVRHNNKVSLITGSAQNNFDTALNEFKELAHTVTEK